MASQEAESRAKEAIALIDEGQLEAASRKLREASSIDESNTTVKEAWEKLRKEDDGPALPALAQKFLASGDDTDGYALNDYLVKHPSATQENLSKTMEILMKYTGDEDIADETTGALLKTSGARDVLAAALIKTPTVTFNTIFERGDDSSDGQTDMLLDPKSWPTEKDRIAAERDVFQLCLAQLMKAGQDFPERAMKALSRLLGAEAKNLNGLIDADGFDVICSNFDIRLPQTLRGFATLACVKLLELSPDTAKQLIAQYVVQRVEKPTHDKMIQSFSAAAAVFPMAPDAAAELFLTAGFLPNFLKLINKWKSYRVEQAALELLNAACMDARCREAITKYCPEWLEKMKTAGTNTDPRRMSQVTTANLVLEKIKDAKSEGENKPNPNAIEDISAQEDRMDRFREIIADFKSDSSSKSSALEGLAYASMKPWAKDKLAGDPTFLKSLVAVMDDKTYSSSALFGGLTIVANLTTYRPVLSEEQKKLSELKAYANSAKPSALDPLDDDAKVSTRCIQVLKAGIVPLFNTHSKTLTNSTLLLAIQILNSLAKEKTHRGTLAQQGALKFLLQAHDRLTSTPSPPPNATTVALTASHAIARILISVNPLHAFTSASPSISSTIRPLTSLLTPDSPTSFTESSSNAEPPRTLLPTFEALLALTNLASVSEPICTAITRLAMTALDDLMLSTNTLVQRAATELLCNLCSAPAGAAQFTGARGPARLQLMLALTDAEDMATRRAAAGALAMVSEYGEVVESLIGIDKGMERLVGAVGDESAEVRLRAAVAVRNCVCAEGSAGRRAADGVRRVSALAATLEGAVRNGDAEIGGIIGEIAVALGA
ncbi:ARM repeat-containing protein [Microthyrium microscopicum]|uniref:ARM repeat-containing protein n=1 Tax=Microthyrium microscopicum TaxID=703497 RepID=A0A6A6U8H1_9PEZI|nr:ARM repeat-containing protein [Microthyrium microscopicum]